jgi:hypothetical protein
VLEAQVLKAAHAEALDDTKAIALLGKPAVAPGECKGEVAQSAAAQVQRLHECKTPQPVQREKIIWTSPRS